MTPSSSTNKHSLRTTVHPIELAHDWVLHLNYDFNLLGEDILVGCTAKSSLLLSFRLHNKKLQQLDKDLPINEDKDSSA